jgi:hypothetical protein
VHVNEALRRLRRFKRVEILPARVGPCEITPKEKSKHCLKHTPTPVDEYGMDYLLFALLPYLQINEIVIQKRFVRRVKLPCIVEISHQKLDMNIR